MSSNRQSALRLLDEGFRLFRRGFAADAWIYYASAAPVALLTLAMLQHAAAVRVGAVELAEMALAWAAAYALRVWGEGAWLRRVRQRAFGEVPGAGITGWYARLRELALRSLLLWIWLLTLPLLVGIPYFYIAAQLGGVVASERKPLRAALRLGFAGLGWPWVLLLLASGFWLVLAVNFAIVVVAAPQIAHALFGLGGALTLAGAAGILVHSFLFWVAIAAAAYLALDPVVKCALLFASHEHDAERSGAGLLAAFERLPRVPVVTVALVAGILVPAPLRARALPAPPSRAVVAAAAVPPALTPEVMRRALGAELGTAPYQWHADPSASGRFGRALERLGRHLRLPAAIHSWLSRVLHAIGNWLRHLLGGGGEPAAGTPAPSNWRWVAWAVAVLALVLALGLILRRRRFAATTLAAASVAVPVALEQATGEERGAEAWFELAAGLAAAGDLRLALRAAFLGALAGLAARQYLTLRRDRTNREYLAEFRRQVGLRDRDAATVGGEPLGDVLRRSILQFDAVWYGGRAVTAEHLAEFLARQREMLAHA